MPLPAPSANVDNAISDYLSGMSCQVSSGRNGVSEARLRTILKSQGLWRTPEQRSALKAQHISEALLQCVDSENVVSRYVGGESENEIAKSLGVSRTLVRKRLTMAGVPLRDNATANRQMVAGRSAEENAALIAAAHAAVKGSTYTDQHVSNIASSREKLLTHATAEELEFARWVTERGIECVPQKAVGRYNVDLATSSVAVEIFGGGWHAYGEHRRRAEKRLDYILDQGWNLLIIWASANRYPLSAAAADQVVAFTKETRRNPATRGQNRVIWGDGKVASSGSLDVTDLALVPSRSGRRWGRSSDDGSGE